MLALWSSSYSLWYNQTVDWTALTARLISESCLITAQLCLTLVETIKRQCLNFIAIVYIVKVIKVDGDIILGGLMSVHGRHSRYVCGRLLPAIGVMATEAMLYTIDYVNNVDLIPGVRLGARIKDDCDRDAYGLDQSINFIQGADVLLRSIIRSLCRRWSTAVLTNC